MSHSDSLEPTLPEGQPSTAPPSAQRLAAPAAQLSPGSVISRYGIESVLGEGGMGVVYLARQERPDRQVALKVIRPGFANTRMLRRFEQEAEVLGRLLHPGIAQIYEAGTADAGYGPQPFFAMELVRGLPLTEYASEKQLTTHQRLELMTKVCDAVEHAHQKGVIHRDLKPGNILVTEEGQPKILDFGVARATDSDLQQTTLQTDVGQLIGTIPYMSPEQVGGEPDELDTRSDVYALGVVLFELLAGRLPYSLERRMIHEAARVIREEEPTRLSSINKTLRGDVETIVSHALEKEKDRRYQTASALGADIRRYLADEPITARPASTWYQLQKFSRRNRALVGGVAATFAVLILGLIVSLYAFAEARYQSRLKDDALGLARENESKAKEEAERARLAQGAEKERADELDKVAKFQAAQFEGLDTQLMGIRLRQEMIADAISAMEKAKLPAEEVAAAKEQLEQTLARGNPTNVALKSLYDNIFAPALKAVDEQFADQPLVRARLLQTIADTLGGLGLTARAAGPQASALAIRREALGEEHPATLKSLEGLARVLNDQGKLAEAEEHFREALERTKQQLGAESPETIRIMNNLALLLRERGQLTEAEKLLRESLGGEAVESDHDHATLVVRNSLASVLEDQGRFVEAERLYRQVLELRRDMLGNDDPLTLDATSNYGGIMVSLGNLSDGERYHRESWEAGRRVLGDEHHKTLRYQGNVGHVLEAQGKYADAEPFFRRTYESRVRLLGEEHPETLLSIMNLGALVHSQGNLKEAESLYRRAIEGQRKVLGPEHPMTLTAINNLAFALQELGQLSDAEPLMSEVLDIQRRVLGDHHPETIGTIANLAGLAQSLGQTQKARQLALECVESAKGSLPPDHPLAIATLSVAGGVLLRQAKFDEAEPYLRDALQRCQSALGDNHPNTLKVLSNLGGLFKERGDYGAAEPYFAEALERSLRVLGENHHDTLRCVVNLATVHESQGLVTEAAQGYRTGIEGYRRVLGEANPATLSAVRSLCALLERVDRFSEAEAVWRESITANLSLSGQDDPVAAGLRMELGQALQRARRHKDAATELLEAYRVLSGNPKTPVWHRNSVESLADLYTAWHAVEPGKGYDARAAEWRAKLEELQAATRPASGPATTSVPPASRPADSSARPAA